MTLFNPHKKQLIERIKCQIQQIDDVCRSMANEIYLYSDQRMNKMRERHDQEYADIEQLQKVKTSNIKSKQQLIATLKLLKEQQEDLEQQLANKDRQHEQIQRQIIFAEQKNKEQQPHLAPYLKQKDKANKNNHNIQYAKNKLKILEKTYEKESQELQYKYRLITIMKKQLRDITKQYNNQQEQWSKGNREHLSSVSSGNTFQNAQYNSHLSGIPKRTEQSINQHSSQEELSY